MRCSQLTARDLAPTVTWVGHDHDKLFSPGTGVHRGLRKRVWRNTQPFSDSDVRQSHLSIVPLAIREYGTIERSTT